MKANIKFILMVAAGVLASQAIIKQLPLSVRRLVD